MRLNNTEEGLRAAREQGVSRTQLEALAQSAQYLIEYPAEDVAAITAKVNGVLITGWFLEGQDDGEWYLFMAHEAGLTTVLKWNHVYGRSNPSGE